MQGQVWSFTVIVVTVIVTAIYILLSSNGMVNDSDAFQLIMLAGQLAKYVQGSFCPLPASVSVAVSWCLAVKS